MLFVKNSYNGTTSLYIICAEEEMIYQNYYCPLYSYTSNSITGPSDRVRLSTYGMIIRVIIFDKSVQD
jgi:hypothetical protein